jgi:hypothetical protein
MSDTSIISIASTFVVAAQFGSNIYVTGGWITTYGPTGAIISVTGELHASNAKNGVHADFTDPSVTYDTAGVYAIDFAFDSGTSITDLAIAWTGVRPAFLIPGSVDGPYFSSVVSDGSLLALSDTVPGLIINAIPCFCAGTRIATPEGDVAVEDLALDQMVVLASGEAAPIRWIGHRSIDLTRHKRPDLVRPVRIAAGALADAVPVRDLLVSPDHAMLVDGALVPARLLVNHRTITEETAARTVTYFHVELDRHDIIIAEGAPSESYLDTANRDVFANAKVAAINADLSVEQRLRTPSHGACLPLVTHPDAVFPIWRRIAQRAGLDVGEGSVFAAAPAGQGNIRLVVGTRALRPIVTEADRLIFALPRDAHEVRLISDAMRPNTGRPWLDDRRELGVAVKAISADQTAIALDGPALGAGWWDMEHAGATAFRWTDGSGAIALPEGAKLLTVWLHAAMAELVAQAA